MTKKAVYIFNPEHDLALASGETNYMAPASARQMASELALLADVVCRRGKCCTWLLPLIMLDYREEDTVNLLGLSDVTLMTEPELASER